MKKVIVIGAGIGGMASANLLAQAGYEVHVYEQAGTAGGRAGKLQAAGFTFDTGPSWYLMPEVFTRYYRRFGKDAGRELDVIRLAPSYKVFFEHDDPLVITGDYQTDRATFERVESGAARRLDRYVAGARRLYALALRYFLYTDFSRLRDYLRPGILVRLPQMIGLMVTPIDRHIARFVTAKRLRQILEYPMVFLGTSPFEAPALYSLLGALDFDSGVYYPRGGIYAIIDSLKAIGDEVGVTYHFDSPVAAITSGQGIATGIRLVDGSQVTADIIISNADVHYTETTLLTAADQSFPQRYWNSRQAACSALLIYLGVRGPLTEFEHHNLLFVDAWHENFDALYASKTVPEMASLYLSRTSATDPDTAPEGHETLFVLVPLPAGLSLTADRAEELAAHYLSQIESMTKVSLQDRIVYRSLFTPDDFGTRFHAWQNSMLGPSHLLRQSAFWRTPNRSRVLKNLYYVGAGTTPGVGLPMCLISAENVAARIIREQRA